MSAEESQAGTELGADPARAGLPLIAGADLDAPLAWRDGAPLSRRRYLAEVEALALRLPNEGAMLNLSADRFDFAVGLGAAMRRGHCNLMPPNHTPDTVARLRAAFPAAYGLGAERSAELGLPLIADAGPLDLDPAARPAAVPRFDADRLTAQVLTSGSTGAPVPHPKRWGLLVRNTEAGARRLAEQMGRANLGGVTLVATVPPQHMYGFESTVLIALLAGAAFDAGRPFYPEDIAATLRRTAAPRMLVTTPFHLKALLDAGIALPPVDLTVSATAPLPPQLAARAEAALGGPLMEIYGCTEAGQIATRRTTAGPEWRTYDDVRINGDGAEAIVRDGHVPQPTLLADVLEVLAPTRFRLLGRSNDLVNVAGKRSSLGHLNFHLNSIRGVRDGAFWLPPDPNAAGVVRPVAFVVPEGAVGADWQQGIVQALRQRLDPAFLPRRLVAVAELPREPGTGKLPALAFAAWAERRLAGG